MDEPALHDLAEELDQMIWSRPADDLKQEEPAIRARIRDEGQEVETVLRELSDETLGEAFCKGFLRRLVFQEWLVHRYESDLIRWFQRQTKDVHLAQDLTHEIYLSLLEGGANTYNPEFLFHPWLRRVARNRLWDHFRRSTHRLAAVSLPEQGPCSSGPGPEEEAVARETQQRFEEAVALLPQEQQRVIRGAACGASADELASEMQLPKTRVYRLLFKARRSVAATLKEGFASPLVEP